MSNFFDGMTPREVLDSWDVRYPECAGCPRRVKILMEGWKRKRLRDSYLAEQVRLRAIWEADREIEEARVGTRVLLSPERRRNYQGFDKVGDYLARARQMHFADKSLVPCVFLSQRSRFQVLELQDLGLYGSSFCMEDPSSSVCMVQPNGDYTWRFPLLIWEPSHTGKGGL